MNIRKKTSGFTLVELMIVMVIIVVIAAIAIPTYISMKAKADQTAAVGAVRTLTTASIAFNASYPGGTLALGALGGVSPCVPSAATACFIDNKLATATSTTATRSGYYFTVVPGSTANLFEIKAIPASAAGINYCSDQTGIIRYSTSTIAGDCSAVAELATSGVVH